MSGLQMAASVPLSKYLLRILLMRSFFLGRLKSSMSVRALLLLRQRQGRSSGVKVRWKDGSGGQSQNTLAFNEGPLQQGPASREPCSQWFRSKYRKIQIPSSSGIFKTGPCPVNVSIYHLH
ncbi:uncharacterized protein LOC143818180 [Ranitomeya variabilis]|uniref:uncharacterized protein LOC143818180 n=1 Tax=Ranitomeya variabilis TaxID=490064 RepID=UPI004055EEF6